MSKAVSSLIGFTRGTFEGKIKDYGFKDEKFTLIGKQESDILVGVVDVKKGDIIDDV